MRCIYTIWFTTFTEEKKQTINKIQLKEATKKTHKKGQKIMSVRGLKTKVIL